MKRILIVILVAITSSHLSANEGMWLPLFLEQLNEAEMRGLGMKMSAEDIYSINRGSLKDAIVHFGGFCTGEVISDQGLVLTNHHCGLGAIRTHSSLENNYLDQGFWASDRSSELPNAGLFVTFIIRIEDVTEAALSGITDDMVENVRQATIDRNLNAIKAGADKEEYQDVLIRPFFKGNQYFLFVTETYRDVRLVGAPPSSIGKFGADTDNWVWPRHTGDFSLFRIYADRNNRPAAYSPDNVPFRPRHSLPISLDGIEEGDFTLVFGFPGRTNEYLPADAVEMQVDVLNPIRIGIRDKSLAIMDAAMREDPQVRIQYASKQAGLANSWKKWIGERQGIKATGGIEKKKAFEESFTQRINARPAWKKAYGQLLPEFHRLYQTLKPYAESLEYASEIGNRNIELFRLANTFEQFLRIYDNSGIGALESRKDRLIDYLNAFYKDYRPDIDRQIMATLLETYFQEMNIEHLSPIVAEAVTQSGKDYGQLAENVFSQSILAKPDQLLPILNNDLEEGLRIVREDPAYRLARSIIETNQERVMPKYQELEDEIEKHQRTYMKALMEVFPEKRFYPDANSTLRVTYGQVASYSPRDAVQYEPVTYLEGVMEKYQPGDYEFDVPERLRDLYARKDYGPYGDDGRMPVCFIGTNHTTGGNSGSPAIDAYGNLIGLNFDRVWEGTMSDMYYDPSICRNIMVDIRYVLFLIDKMGGARHLVDEMKLVHPKKKG